MDFDINKLHKIEAEMLNEFVEFCEERKIKYFLIGGSALGAVRHKGFIPWDDDIDIGIPRKDYDKLLSIPESELPLSCIINCFNNEIEYPYYFAKVCNQDTVLIEKMTQHLNFRQHVYIDIFPLDGAPETKFMQRIHFFRIRLYKKLQNLHHGMTKTDINFGKKVVISLIKTFFTREWIHLKLDRLAKKYSYEESKFISNYFGAWGHKEITPKRFFGEGKNVYFENRNYNIPADADGYLKLLYNDYMKLPPKDKQKSHHEFVEVRL